MSKPWLRLTCGMAMVTLAATPAAGQTSRPAEPRAASLTLPIKSLDDLKAAIDPASVVEVTSTNGRYIFGTVSDGTSAQLHLRGLDGNMYAFDRASVDRITEKDSTRDGTIAGAIIGAIPGLIGGLILNKICYNEIGSCPGAAIGLTALGAGVGAGIGFVADNGRQKLIYDRKLASANPTLVFRTALRWR